MTVSGWGVDLTDILEMLVLGRVPSRELTYPTLEKGKSSTQNAIFEGYVTFREGNCFEKKR